MQGWCQDQGPEARQPLKPGQVQPSRGRAAHKLNSQFGPRHQKGLLIIQKDSSCQQEEVKFTNAADLVERSLAEESETCV